MINVKLFWLRVLCSSLGHEWGEWFSVTRKPISRRVCDRCEAVEERHREVIKRRKKKAPPVLTDKVSTLPERAQERKQK